MALRGALSLGASLLLAASAQAQELPLCSDVPFTGGATTTQCLQPCPDPEDGSAVCLTLGGGFFLGGCSCDEFVPECTDPITSIPCLSPPLDVIGCHNQGQIIQKDCLGAPDPVGDPFVRAVTDEAVASVLESHLLPPADEDLVLHFARSNVRAGFFGKLIEIIQKSDGERSAEENELVAYYTNELRNLRIAEAEISEAEYAKYLAEGQCGYVPPAGFTFEFPSACYTPLGIFDPTPAHPTLEEFKAYGYAAVTQELLDDPEALAAIDGTSRAIGFGVAAVAAVGIVIGVYAAVVLTATVVGTLYAAIFPFGVGMGWAALAAKSAAFAAGAFSAAAAGVAGAVGIVIFAVIFIVFSFIDLFDFATFQEKVTSLVEVAQTEEIDLRDVINDSVGMSELYQAYLKTTLPEFPPAAPVPAVSVCDPLFALADENGSSLGESATIRPLVDLSFSNIDPEIGLRGGWFAPTLTISDPEQPGQPPSVESQLSLSIPVLGWDGRPRDVWRRGDQFVVIDPEDLRNARFDLAQATPSFEFVDTNGVHVSASLAYDDSAECGDQCPDDPDKTRPGACGCGVADLDASGDGIPDCFDSCPDDPDKTHPGCSGCGVVDPDADGDGAPDCFDACPEDGDKTAPGACGCDIEDADSDGDGAIDCLESCPDDPTKTMLGACGCGVPDDDFDGDTTPDCLDQCLFDPGKVAPGVCGCGTADGDSDGDGTADCIDGCVDDPGKIAAGACGCGTPDDDLDGDGWLRCLDNCPDAANAGQEDFDGDGSGDVCDADADADGVVDAADACVLTTLGALVDAGGCSLAQLAPCEGPPGTTDGWKNHGKYVSFLTQQVKTFVTAGLMTEEEADALLLAEGENDCGR